MIKNQKPLRNKTFQEATMKELTNEAKRQMGLKELRCPECKAPVLATHIEEDCEVVVFKCLFSATFDRGIQPAEAQKRLNEFKSSGEMLEWMKKPLFADAIADAKRKNAIRNGFEVV